MIVKTQVRVRAVLCSAAVACVVGAAGPAAAQQPGDAPFRPGEVVLAGAPGDLPPGLTVVKYLRSAGLTVVAAPRGGEQALARQLRGQGRRAGVNRIAQATASPNDAYYPYQWHFHNVQAEQAWSLSTGAGVIVAVLDTGLATVGAMDGIGCVVPGRDVVNGDDDPVDGDGHGTHVAGTIAQATGNGAGVAGLAHGACIMPVKVLDDAGSGSFADIAEGLYWAVANGAHVVNMSLSTSARFGIRNDPLVDPALDHCWNSGVTVVCATGNDGSRKNAGYPAIYPTTIGVGATDYRNAVTRYSNRGDGLDLVAPGGDNARDDNRDGYADGVLQETMGSNGWGYFFYSGTSMASPHVAAAAALLIAHGVTGPQEVLDRLTFTAADLGEAGYDVTSGWGLLQAYDALVGSSVEPPPCTDADGDGWCVEDGDCDDTNPFVNPGEVEVCDGIDNNCDGVIDEGCGGGGCTDADGDGWCIEDGDCDDNDPDVFPGHPDKGGRWGRDGKDNDCNGVIDG